MLEQSGEKAPDHTLKMRVCTCACPGNTWLGLCCPQHRPPLPLLWVVSSARLLWASQTAVSLDSFQFCFSVQTCREEAGWYCGFHFFLHFQ